MGVRARGGGVQWVRDRRRSRRSNGREGVVLRGRTNCERWRSELGFLQAGHRFRWVEDALRARAGRGGVRIEQYGCRPRWFVERGRGAAHENGCVLLTILDG